MSSKPKFHFHPSCLWNVCKCANVLCIQHFKRVPSPPHLPPSIPAEMKYFKTISKLFLSLFSFAMTFCLWVGADSTRPSGRFCHCTVTAALAAFATVLWLRKSPLFATVLWLRKSTKSKNLSGTTHWNYVRTAHGLVTQTLRSWFQQPLKRLSKNQLQIENNLARYHQHPGECGSLLLLLVSEAEGWGERRPPDTEANPLAPLSAISQSPKVVTSSLTSFPCI